MAIHWNENDLAQVQCLAWLGEDSIVWRKAPETVQTAARALLASGWEPDSAIPDKALGIDEITEDDLW